MTPQGTNYVTSQWTNYLTLEGTKYGTNYVTPQVKGTNLTCEGTNYVTPQGTVTDYHDDLNLKGHTLCVLHNHSSERGRPGPIPTVTGSAQSVWRAWQARPNLCPAVSAAINLASVAGLAQIRQSMSPARMAGPGQPLSGSERN